MGGDRRLQFQVQEEDDGGYSAQCFSYDIFTQGESFEELRTNIREVVEAYFFDQPGEYEVTIVYHSREPILVSA